MGIYHKHVPTAQGAMKQILKSGTFTLPAGVTATIKARVVTVKGPRGSLTVTMNHMPIDISFSDEAKKTIQIDRWFTSGKANACIRTTQSHISNACIGVTRGFLYKMRFVYAHFPINVAITNKDSRVEIRNFLGEEIVLQGNSIDDVSRTCALIQQICEVKRKDIRKFLDGIYVSYKGNIIEE